MEAASAPPRYEDIVYVTKENEYKQEILAVPPPAVQPPAVQPIAVQPPAGPVPESSVKVILNVINALTHFFLGAVVFSAFMIANTGPIYNNIVTSKTGAFTLHIYLCVTGYVILLSQAILSFSPHVGWAHGLKYPQKLLITGVLQIFGSSLALAGCLIKITDWTYYRMSNDGHVVTGWIVMVLTFLSLIGGILNFKYADRISQGPYKNAHAYLFIFTLTMAFICICFGFGEQTFFNDYVNSDFSITFTVFALVGILISARSRIK